jgi:hypothetical protein
MEVKMYSPDESKIVDAIENGEAQKQNFDNDNLKDMAAQTLKYLNTKKEN